jgi:hypothetical protein
VTLNLDQEREIWLLLTHDGAVVRASNDAFPGAVRFRATQASSPRLPAEQTAPAAPQAGSRAIGEHRPDPAVGERMFERIHDVTADLIREFPDAAEAIGLAGARIARMHLGDRTPVARRPAGLLGPLLCAVGWHRLMPLRWITGDRSNRGLVCNRCYRQFPPA